MPAGVWVALATAADPAQPGTAWRGPPDFSKDEDGHKETARDHVISGRGY